MGTRSSARRTVVSPVGEIELTTAAKLRRALDAVLRSPPGEIWIDLTRVTFMDVSGLHVLLAAQRALDRAHRHLDVVVPDGILQRLIEIGDCAGTLALHRDRRRTPRTG